jgi:succinate dehydrogenase subunit D
MTGAIRARGHPGFWAFALHRISGIALALFLPFHFWALSRALAGDATLERFLRWTDAPLVQLAEWGLVVLLALHFGGGIRVLMLEFLPWREWHKALLACAAAAAVAAGLAFALAR